ncbi:YjbF family lipoprotein [Frigidibacter sp. ROC022]|uniref:YjbF family lipoprotein n=1 Tax=Frigidibacter sp. ROC022 TaxID=2971796 RepID=UPI00215A2182|nr:YjbF family lipoprotein [Frigidibacter sp. ROC022]MCR8724185.1 YjbF family lipoprotein [Frigidibacter sp. ROC022]
MGDVLAMIRGMVLALALGLAACSSGGEGTTSPLTEATRLITQKIKGRNKAPPPPAAQLTRAALEDAKGPLILASIERSKAAATLRLARQNGGYGTWVSLDKLSVTLKQGVLSASRGLPGDLLAGETDATLAALRTDESSSYGKVMRYIGGDRQILKSRLSCRMDPVGAETIEILERSHATRHMAEVCSDSYGGTIRNDYWIGDDGTLWQSRQYLHPVMGYITFQQLLK